MSGETSIHDRLIELLETVAEAQDDYMLSEVKVDIPAGGYPRQYLQPAAKALLKELREGAEALSPQPSDSERTVASIAAMLGWMNVPPRETLESDIQALKARAKERICRCGTTMVCPDIGCDSNKSGEEAPARSLPSPPTKEEETVRASERSTASEAPPSPGDDA